LTNFSNFVSHNKANLRSYQLNFLSPYFMGGQLLVAGCWLLVPSSEFKEFRVSGSEFVL